MVRLGMNTIRAGGAVPTAGSNVSSVAMAVPGLQSSLVGVYSGMLTRPLSAMHWASAALWGSSGVLFGCTLECSSGIFYCSADRPLSVPRQVGHHLALLGCLHCRVIECPGKLDTLGKGGLATGMVRITGECTLRLSLETVVNFPGQWCLWLLM